MSAHLWRLIIRAWLKMASGTGTNTLGLIVWTVSLPLAIWFVQVVYEALKERKSLGLWKAIRGAVTSTLKTPVFGTAGTLLLATLALGISVVKTVYDDHVYWVAQNTAKDARIADLQKTGATALENDRSAAGREIAKLKADLNFHRHNLATTDPVFGNLIYMLQAFRVFRSYIHSESCVVMVTAIPGSGPSSAMAMSFSQLSIQASNCATFGPMSSENDPDGIEMSKRGSVPDAIVFHAPRDDKAAMALYDALGSQIHLVRSYEMPEKPSYQTPSGGYAHMIWLQFGEKVKWNSEVSR